jgi:AcrR family transcriptional regulator
MKNKEIQEERMRRYFIDAAKEILRSEGLKSISVRNIADRAGYSYATLYNYFRDVKDLIFECVKDFQEECNVFISSNIPNSQSGKEQIRGITLQYIRYFLEYPGIFDLFFLEKLNDINSKKGTHQVITNFLEDLCGEAWLVAVANGDFSESEANFKKQQLLYITTGLLLVYHNRRIPDTYAEFMERAENQLRAVL